MESSSRGTILFEYLGEPVQRLLRALKGDMSQEDMSLLEHVSVKDMAKIYSDMSIDRHADEIWEELRKALQERQKKSVQRERELVARQQALEQERRAEEERQRLQDEEEERERLEVERALLRHQEEQRLQHLREEADASAEQEAAAAAAAEAEKQRLKAEKKRKRREARARELQEEQEALEKARREATRRSNQQKEWADYVESHPLEFKKTGACLEGEGEITQKKLQHFLNAPPKTSEALLNRTYTPRCPNCNAKFASPPVEWECPMCLRQEKKHILVWQPDTDSPVCMVCKANIGRWSRHHCRNCGRLVCSNCCGARAIIAALGYHTAVKVCNDCAQP